MWKFGDQGSVIVIVQQDVPTQTLFYTLDEGEQWNEYRFADQDFRVEYMSTVPSDKSRNFVLWGRDPAKRDHVVTVNIDFSGLTDKQCVLNEKDPEADDYYNWSPKHPNQPDDCLLGHVAQYHRKKVEANCFNGWVSRQDHDHAIARNCACTREDFEWYVSPTSTSNLSTSCADFCPFKSDYNYERANDGTCQLAPGASPPDHSQRCKDDPDLVSYYLPTGYRRTPLDTCEGGRELEFIPAKEMYCKDHKEEWEEKQRSKGLSGFWFFVLVILLPFGAAAGIGWWVWKNWDGKFGRIRLGEGGDRGAFDAEQPWIKYPVIVISGVVAVAVAMPMLIGAGWRWVSGFFGGGRRYTSRSDFARGGRYAVVDENEDELLGDDDEDAIGEGV